MYSSLCNAEGNVLSGHQPILTTDSTPMDKRFGGWFVTGVSNQQKNLGNLWFGEKESPDEAANYRANCPENLTSLVDVSQLSTPFSDMACLMVFGHQLRLQNLLADAAYQTNSALILEELHSGRRSLPGGSSSTVIKRVCEPVVQALLFAREARLNGPISGRSGFTESFSRVGPRDRRGRSLRDLDLKRRLFRYPCSYLIYSKSFEALPIAAKRYIYSRVWEVLSGRDRSETFSHLSVADRNAITQILMDTKPGFAKSKPRH
jgi:hypothetical protein